MKRPQCKLYYAPPSYYSQKALIACAEAKLSYEPVIIDIHSATQQKEPWYMRLNPGGTVPTLQCGDKLITESEDIVSHVLKDTPMLPDVNTGVGRSVEEWRKTINSVSIEKITMGTLCFPELSATGLPGMMKAFNKESGRFQQQAEACETLAQKHPDLRDAYTAKAAKLKKFVEVFGDKEQAVTALDDLEATMDRVERQLAAREAAGEHWLCGPQFTAADINLCIMLGRLDILGHGARYYTEHKRPHIYAYWQTAKMRPSVNKFTVSIRRTLILMKLGQVAKSVLPVLVLGLAAGLGYFLFQKHKQ